MNLVKFQRNNTSPTIVVTYIQHYHMTIQHNIIIFQHCDVQIRYVFIAHRMCLHTTLAIIQFKHYYSQTHDNYDVHTPTDYIKS